MFFILAFTSISIGSGNISVISSWISNSTPLVILSMAAAIVISSGHIDISTGPLMGLLGMFMIFFVSMYGLTEFGAYYLHVLVIIIALLFYGLVFLLIRKNISSLIITLSAYFIAKGISVLLQSCLQGAGAICRSEDVLSFQTTSGVLPSKYVFSSIGSLPASIFIITTLTMVVYFWRFHTRSGLEHVAVGMDRASAKFIGVGAQKVYFWAFTFAGCLVSLATIVRIHGQTNGGWSANTGWGEELLAIAIAVIGGTRISGGRLDPISISLAALIIYAMRDVVTNDLRLPSELASIVFGAIMAIVIILDSRRQSRAGA